MVRPRIGDQLADVDDEAVARVRRVRERRVEARRLVTGDAVAVGQAAGCHLQVAVAARVGVDHAVDQELDEADAAVADLDAGVEGEADERRQVADWDCRCCSGRSGSRSPEATRGRRREPADECC